MNAQTVLGGEKCGADVLWTENIQAAQQVEGMGPQNGHVYQMQASANEVQMTRFCVIRHQGMRPTFLARTFPGGGVIRVVIRAGIFLERRLRISLAMRAAALVGHLDRLFFGLVGNRCAEIQKRQAGAAAGPGAGGRKKDQEVRRDPMKHFSFA